ncbi:MAG TPA: hypothetical protein VEZ11_02605, partial [Thermoanaerobaculia bacterium]|nr:hypothetical protein [Thermoanaerobaculia bacterium]
VCRAGQPLCLVCPLQSECKALRSGRANELPKRGEKKATVALRIPLYLISDRRGRLMMRREKGPLMNAMLHLPHGDSSILEGPPLAAISKNFLGTFRHTITNRRIIFEVHEAEMLNTLRDSPGDWTWIDPADLGQLPHPSYVKKALRIAEASSKPPPEGEPQGGG